MNIPITKRVMMGGGKKGCGCGGDCQCNAAPGKMWGAAKVAHGKKSPAKKGSCGGKRY